MSSQPALFEVAEGADGVGSPRRIRGGKRFIAIPGRDQMALEVRRVEDMVLADRPVRVFDAIMDRLDYGALEDGFVGGGRPAYAPRFLCKLLFWAAHEGIRSAREISRRLHSDLNFMWLAHEVKVDHQTLSDFRREFGAQFKALFVQTVALGIEVGLVRFGWLAIDGTKIAAHARRGMYNEATLKEALARVEQRIAEWLAEGERTDAEEDGALGAARGDELPAELQDAERLREKLLVAQAALAQSDQKAISLGDAEAPKQKSQDGKRPGYNGQLAVDGETGFVVAEALTDAQNDQQEFAGVAREAVSNLGRKPEAVVADKGYQSEATLDAIAEEELNAYVAQPQVQTAEGYGHEAFGYDGERDEYLCPGGARLTFWKLKALRTTAYRVYRSSRTSCRVCPHQTPCLGKRKERRRELLIPPHAALLAGMRAKMATDAGRQALQVRKQSVEPVFGVMKSVLGLRQFLLRGIEGARAEFRIAAIAVNLRKLVACGACHREALCAS